jgi:hypothetical protein
VEDPFKIERDELDVKIKQTIEQANAVFRPRVEKVRDLRELAKVHREYQYHLLHALAPLVKMTCRLPPPPIVIESSHLTSRPPRA